MVDYNNIPSKKRLVSCAISLSSIEAPLEINGEVNSSLYFLVEMRFKKALLANTPINSTSSIILVIVT
eukprot:13648138-Ditylum_brightwellii.AAC.1